MRVRYPEGFVSLIDADPHVAGDPRGARAQRHGQGPQRAVDAAHRSRRRISSTSAAAAPPRLTTAPAVQTFPLRLNIDIDAPSTRCGSRTTSRKLVASADLKLQGTYDRPQLFGHAEIDRGDLVFEGNRYIVTRGGIDFFNASPDRAGLRHRG